jgi:hypothetical protein
MNSIKQLAWLSVLLLCACSPVTTNSSPTSTSSTVLASTPTCQIVCKVNENNSATPAAIQPTSEYSPQAGDSLLTKQNAFVGSQELLTTETNPPQFKLHLVGSLPTPCNSLRINLNPPDVNNLIAVEVYSVVSANEVCAQMTKSFDVSIPIVVASGSYTISANGQPASSLVMP